MSRKTIREDYLDGIRVKVVSKPRGFDVSINIEKGTFLRKKRKSQKCWIAATTSCHNQVADSDISIKLKNQQYDRKNLNRHFRKTIELKEGGEIKISLFPSFYLTEELAEKARAEWKSRKGSCS